MKKKPEEYALEYAGFWIRLGAVIIDLIILSIICYAVFRFIILMIPPSVFIIIFAFIAWLIEIVYVVAFWAWRGQTPGKMIFKLYPVLPSRFIKDISYKP